MLFVPYALIRNCAEKNNQSGARNTLKDVSITVANVYIIAQSMF